MDLEFKTLSFGCDHAAVEMKNQLIRIAEDLGITCIDEGPTSSERVDYPDYAKKVANKVSLNEVDAGVLVCGSGVGMSITANKVNGVRAVVCTEPYSATMSRAHNDANVLCLGARVVGPDMAEMILKSWLTTSFEGGRHEGRVAKIEP